MNSCLFTAELVQGLEDHPQRRQCFRHHALGGSGCHTASRPSHKQASPPAFTGRLQNRRQVDNTTNMSLKVPQFKNVHIRRSIKHCKTVTAAIVDMNPRKPMCVESFSDYPHWVSFDLYACFKLQFAMTVSEKKKQKPKRSPTHPVCFLNPAQGGLQCATCGRGSH